MLRYFSPAASSFWQLGSGLSHPYENQSQYLFSLGPLAASWMAPSCGQSRYYRRILYLEIFQADIHPGYVHSNFSPAACSFRQLGSGLSHPYENQSQNLFTVGPLAASWTAPLCGQSRYCRRILYLEIFQSDFHPGPVPSYLAQLPAHSGS